MKKCNFCGKHNSEVSVCKFRPSSISDIIVYIVTFGKIKHRLCQTCNSKIFRGLDKNK